jgi:hypothetical protein
MNTSNLFQDSGFDLLPKNPVAPTVNNIQIPIAQPTITGPENPVLSIDTEIQAKPGKTSNLAGGLLLVLLLASAAWVIYSARKYGKASSPYNEPES